jgi:hypothetical protein
LGANSSFKILQAKKSHLPVAFLLGAKLSSLLARKQQRLEQMRPLLEQKLARQQAQRLEEQR